MPNATGTAASTTPGAGDSVIFRGGDTWHFVDSAQAPYTGGTWSPVGNGTSTSCNLNAAAGAIVKTTCLYYGTDHTFFAGGSYARPIFTLDNAANTAEVASCAHDNGTFHAITATGKSYFIFDDFEIKGWCFSATVTADVLDLSGTMVEGSNLYFHAWTATTGTIDDSYHMMAGNQARGQYMLCDHIVIDGADSSLGTSTSPYAATGFAIFNTCSEIAFNYISRVSNVMIATPTSVHDNTAQYTFNACCGSHGNLFEWNNNAPAGCVYMYNNVTRYSNQGNGNDFNASNSDCGYQFNNISYFYRMVTSTGANGSDGTNCYNYDPLTSPPTFYDFNNTIDFPCSKTGASTNHATLIVSNEHYIGYSTGVPCTGACTSAISAIYSGNLTTTNNGSHVFQTEATANGQGYVLGNNYAPTSGSNATVGAGTNNTSICTGMDLSTATAACKLSTSGGVTEVSGEGGFIVGGTVTTPQPRPSSGSWDAGAYEFLSNFTYTVTMAGNHAGDTVTSSPAGINCPTTCSASFSIGTSVTLTENPSGQYFAYGFSSPCPTVTNFGAPCTLVISSATSVTANFNHVTLPQLWTNNMEYLFATSNVVNFPTFWLCNGGTRYPASGNYANTAAGLQQAANDIMQCRHDTNTGTTLIIPSGQLYSSANGLQWTQLAGDNSTQFAVQTSSNPAPLGITLCSHGIQDNIPGATRPGLWNPGCTGLNMYYQLGTTINSIPAGAFTLANNTATNTSQYNDISHLYTIEATGANQNALSTCVTFVGGNCTADWDTNNVGVHHIAILNAELRPVAGQASAGAPYKVGLATETLVSQIPNHIHLAYSYIHGDWQEAPMSGCPSACVATGIPAGTNSLPYAMFIAGCLFCSEMYNYVDGNLRPGAEGHGIGLLLGQENKRGHNWIAGGSIGFIAGGWGASMPIANFVTCLNDEDRANRYTYPYSWMLAFNGGFNPSGGSFVRKNAHEYKFCRFALEDGNIYENVDNSGAQNGTVFSHKTAQNSGGGAGNNYWTELTHVTASNIIGRTGCNGPSFGDRSAAVGNGGGVSLPSQMFNLSNWLIYNVSINLPGCSVSGFSSAPQYSVRNGQSVPSATWSATATRDALGQTTTFTLTTGSGNGVTDFSLGDPLTSTGCSDATFNLGNTVMGPPVLAGSTLGTTAPPLTLIVNNPGTANATATGCTVSNAQGYPNYIFLNHATIIADVGHNGPYDSALSGTNIHALARNVSYQNSIFVNGGLSSSSGEGTAASTRDYDPTTFTFNNSFIGGRTAANYTEYPSLASPPTTLYLTPTNSCTGNDPTTGTCLGILAAMSTSTFPLVPGAVGSYIAGDYHAFRLCQATDVACNSKQSLYGAGNTNQATDGTDLGVNFATLDAAQNSTLFVCATPCGLGPSIDTIAIVPAPFVGFGFSKAQPPTLFPKAIGAIQ